MLKYTNKEHLISLHIAKTGGTSFGEILKDWFNPNFYFHYIDEKDGKLPELVKLEKLYFLKFKNICIHGHFENITGRNVFDTYPTSKQFISFIRNPIDQMVSMFFFQQKIIKEHGFILYQKIKYFKPLFLNTETKLLESTNDINYFLSKGKSPILRFIPFDLTSDNFKSIFHTNFIHIGLQEEMSSSIEIIANKLNKTPPIKVNNINKVNYDYIPSKSIINDFNKNHLLEQEIYNFVKQLNKLK